MTNEQIVFQVRLALMDAGKIGGTGKMIELKNEKGEKEVREEPEKIHTFAVWRSLGYSVKRGEKAIAKIEIWKYTEKKEKSDEEEEKGQHAFKKMAFFFSPSQVEPLMAQAKKYEMRVKEDRVPYLVSVGNTGISDDETQQEPESMADIIRTVYHADQLPEEHVYMLAFDTKLHLIGTFDLSHGTADASLICPMAVIQRAMLIGSKKICIAHNHPSGDIEPSSDDEAVTIRLKKAAEICGIDFFDHIIIAGANKNRIYSFRESSSLLN